ncbi:hypothetical protein [Salinisphaera sp. Q1T1-3]|uniref:hypothetical protein n=1 Tax=Salinisphaera sp. Q1T1-3 TaxID=2321229 RepID=UPI001314B777|nr:hypothetical protein [Salinisphaera sp. Q1T1-3]
MQIDDGSVMQLVSLNRDVFVSAKAAVTIYADSDDTQPFIQHVFSLQDNALN